MSEYMAVLHVKAEDECKWLKKLENVTQKKNHVFSNFKSVKIEDREYQVVVDGELYNVEDIKKSLRYKGIEKDIKSIEELVVQAYRIWGHAMMNHFNGAYACIIDDGEEVFVTKDQMGLKPIFYARKKGKGLLVSNAIQAILDTKGVKPIVDRKGLRELFAFGPSISEDRTLYKDIYALPMGHYMVIKNNNVRITQYYEPISKPHFDSFEDTVAKVKYLVEDAIDKQTQDCDATFLSGGLDSSIIAAVMAKKKEHVATYSLDYEGNKENFKGNMYQVSLDDEFIAKMVECTGCDHTKLMITQQELLDKLYPAEEARNLPGMADVDSSLLWLCEQVKKDRSVILSGECSDEVFGGYPWFYREELKDLDTFPWLRSTSERRNLLHEDLKDIDYEGYIQKQYKKTIENITYLDGDNEEDKRARLHTVLCLHWFMQTLVTRQVTMGNKADVTIRAPFADVRILDYVYNIPWDMKFANGNEKGILRKAFEDELPKEVCYRKKNPFPKTHNPEYTERIKEKLWELYDDETSPLHMLFDEDALHELIESGGAAFKLPWYGQLMSGPQLLAYLYQIDHWIRNSEVIIEK